MRRQKKPKVFVIGRNKTGTTSIAAVLEKLGYRLGDQIKAELLLDDWANGQFDPILDYCRSAEAFQDIPFSLEGTYQALDREFPGSKFILTTRDSAQVWYESLTRFHTKIVGKGRLPTASDLQAFEYREPGWLWRAQKQIYGIDEDTLYDPAIYQEHYDRYNEGAVRYFADRPAQFLSINIGDESAPTRLCEFLDVEPSLTSFPHLNRSRD